MTVLERVAKIRALLQPIVIYVQETETLVGMDDVLGAHADSCEALKNIKKELDALVEEHSHEAK